MINVNEILKKHGFIFPEGELPAAITTAQDAIKEIVEEVLKEAAHKARAESWNDQNGLHQEVNEQSILDVAKQVKYD